MTGTGKSRLLTREDFQTSETEFLWGGVARTTFPTPVEHTPAQMAETGSGRLLYVEMFSRTPGAGLLRGVGR